MIQSLLNGCGFDGLHCCCAVRFRRSRLRRLVRRLFLSSRRLCWSSSWLLIASPMIRRVRDSMMRNSGDFGGCGGCGGDAESSVALADASLASTMRSCRLRAGAICRCGPSLEHSRAIFKIYIIDKLE